MTEYTVRRDYVDVHDDAVASGWEAQDTHRGVLHLTHENHFGKINVPLHGTADGSFLVPEAVAAKVQRTRALTASIAAERLRTRRKNGSSQPDAAAVPASTAVRATPAAQPVRSAGVELLSVEACHGSKHRVVGGVVLPKDLTSFRRIWSDGSSDHLCAVVGCGNAALDTRGAGAHFRWNHPTFADELLTERVIMGREILSRSSADADSSSPGDDRAITVAEACAEADAEHGAEHGAPGPRAEQPGDLPVVMIRTGGDHGRHYALRFMQADGTHRYLCSDPSCGRVFPGNKNASIHFGRSHAGVTELLTPEQAQAVVATMNSGGSEESMTPDQDVKKLLAAIARRDAIIAELNRTIKALSLIGQG